MTTRDKREWKGRGSARSMMDRLGVGWVIPRQMHWEPPTDVYENDEGLVVQVEIGGMDADDFSITLAQRSLTISGTREDPEPKRAYRQMEIYYGPFLVEVSLPWAVAAEKVEATYEQGVLRVFLPRPPAHRVSVSEIVE